MENKEYMLIDGNPVEINGEKNLLEVIRKAGIELPTFCYHSELSVYGACRMCMVENSHGGMEAACSTVPKAGMEIYTNTERLHKHRKMILELLLAAHDCSCTTCAKSGNCRLQELAQRFGVGSGGSPLVSGHSAANNALEHDLAAYVQLPRARYFYAGYATNTGIIPALVGDGDPLFSDALNHACLIDGARL